MQSSSSRVASSSLAALLTACGAQSAGDVSHGVGSSDEPTPRLATLSTPSSAATTCTTTTPSSGWVGGSIGSRTGTFTVSMDATPTANPSDALIGLSSGVAATYTDLAAIVRFNPAGFIDVRNGSVYGADRTIAYNAGTTYHVDIDVNTTTHTYTVRVPSPGGDAPLASNFAFRTERATALLFDHYATKVDAGDALRVCGVAVAVPGNCQVAVPGGGFVNRAFAPEQVFLTASFTATPAAAGIDGVVGLSSNPAAAFNDLAAAVRFNPQGTIDVRGTSAYGVELVVPYAAVHPYTFQLITDVLGHSYSVLLGGELIARASGFRAQQAAVASLANQALTVDSPAGPLTMCDVVVSPAKGVLYAHDMNTFQPATLPQSLAALPNGTMLLADQTRTLTLDTQGKVIHTAPHGGFVATDGAGNAYLVGSFTGTYDGGGGPMVSAGGVDAYVSKYGPGWNHLWSRTLGGAGDDAAAAPAVNARGDVLLGVGPTLIRLNPDGTTAWSSASSVGAIALDPTGNAIFTGPPDAVRSIAIAKVDRNGKAVWNRHFPITQGGAGLQLIRTDTSGNVIFSGGINGSVDFGVAQLTARSSEDGDQIFVAKLDSTGAYVYGAIGNLHVLRSLAVDSAGNALVAGYHVNVDHPVLDEFGPTGSGLHEWLGTEVSPLFQFGSSGTLLMTDSARNIYWQLSPRIGSGNGLDYLVKLAP